MTWLLLGTHAAAFSYGRLARITRTGAKIVASEVFLPPGQTVSHLAAGPDGDVYVLAKSSESGPGLNDLIWYARLP